jgi:predicted secreted protein
MPSFLGAHGYDPGPTQRPIAAGAITGLLATAPAIALLQAFGSLEVEARILGTSIAATLAAGSIVMAVAGTLYSRLFGRAANDVRGGWLFGMAFGFVLWTAGAVLVLPLVSGGKSPAGDAALGVLLSMIVWGAALGALLPFVHRPLHKSLESEARSPSSGPSAQLPRSRR